MSVANCLLLLLARSSDQVINSKSVCLPGLLRPCFRCLSHNTSYYFHHLIQLNSIGTLTTLALTLILNLSTWNKVNGMFLIERPEGFFFHPSCEKKSAILRRLILSPKIKKFHEPFLATPLFVQIYTILCWWMMLAIADTRPSSRNPVNWDLTRY